jgi:hypothetical protein
VTQEAMSITPIIFVLVILLFGFDSAGQVRSAGNTANDHTRDVRLLKSQRRIDINYVDELVVKEFFEPSPGPSNPEFS